MNKKFYEKPSLELIKLLNIDIITESEPFEEDEEDIDFGDDTSSDGGSYGFN